MCSCYYSQTAIDRELSSKFDQIQMEMTFIDHRLPLSRQIGSMLTRPGAKNGGRGGSRGTPGGQQSTRMGVEPPGGMDLSLLLPPLHNQVNLRLHRQQCLHYQN